MAEPQASPVDAAFARKVRASRMTLYFERLWPRLWLILGVAGLFLLVSLLNVWAHLPQPAHIALLAGFAVSALAAVICSPRACNYPGREEAVRRLERVSGIPHRPASSYEDTITANAEDPRTSAIWQAHRARLSAAMARLPRRSPASAHRPRRPVALRALLLLGVVAVAALVGDSASDRLALRLPLQLARRPRLGAPRRLGDTRPPTPRGPPLMLADGARGGTAPTPATS